MPRGRPPVSESGLLQAGLDLAPEHGLNSLTVDAVIDRAGTGKGTFYRHFGDRGGFLRAVHAELRHRVWSAATVAMGDAAPGADRLRRGVTAYLDACLSNPALKAFVTEARSEPRVALAVEQDLAAGADVVSVDLAAIGWARPATVARLVMAMAREIALTEHRSTRADPDLRAALTAIMTTPAPGTELIDDPTSFGGRGR